MSKSKRLFDCALTEDLYHTSTAAAIRQAYMDKCHAAWEEYVETYVAVALLAKTMRPAMERLRAAKRAINDLQAISRVPRPLCAARIRQDQTEMRVASEEWRDAREVVSWHRDEWLAKQVPNVSPRLWEYVTSLLAELREEGK